MNMFLPAAVPQFRLLVSVICWGLVWSVGTAAVVNAQEARPGRVNEAWLSGDKFDWTLDQPVVATWQNSELRFAVRSLSEQRKIPVVFDRRLDPNRVFSLEAKDLSLREVFGRLAGASQGSMSITDQVVYLGPVVSVGRLRTLIALRRSELQQVAAKLSVSQRKSLTARHPLSWQDLDSPHEIIQRMAQEYRLQVEHLERVPYDQWGAADLPAISLEEALTLILIQYDLTFQLNANGNRLEVVPIPASLALERKWTLPRTKAEAITRAIRDELPQVVATATAEQLVAHGTQEQLEQLEQLIRTMTGAAVVKKKPPAPTPLSKRRLTFQAKGAPLSAILERISDTGIQFEFDRAKLKGQGIDMDQLVDLDVKDVTPEELFDTLFQPAQIHFEIDGLRVILTPAPRDE